ncbi:MAG: amidohydrolase, partial [Acidimicrobiia bacterium]|nr:amidohydrolase [Acidimicrobiia bacterium]
TVHNVIPESAFLHGTVRALSELTRAKAHGLIRQVAAGVGSAHGLQVDTTIDKGYPVTGNDPGEFNRLMRVGGATGIDVVEMDAPLMGSEDWSYVLARVPGTMAFLGACPPELDPEEAPTNHSNRVRFEEEAMATGAALYAAVASD